MSMLKIRQTVKAAIFIGCMGVTSSPALTISIDDALRASLENSSAIAAARQSWIATREAPIGWFETKKEVQNYADKFKIEHQVSAVDLKAARTTLKLSSAAFADKISVGGTPNTQNKFVF